MYQNKIKLKTFQMIDRLQFVDPDEKEKVPIYRAMNRNGEILDLSTNRNVNIYLIYFEISEIRV